MKRLIFLLITLSCSRYPNPEEVRRVTPSSFKEILDVQGQLLHETRVEFKTQRRAWTKLSELPSAFVEEVLLFEDRRFFSHPGVDPLALLEAVKEYPHRGASTISMQLVGLLKNQTHKRDFTAKLWQMKEALWLESQWQKSDILEAWLNLLTFRGDVQGIRAAALSLFGKDPKLLSVDERLLLYAQIPSPNQKPDKLLTRACRYAQRLRRRCDTLQTTLENSFIESPRVALQSSLAPHVAQRLSSLKQEKILTTLVHRFQFKAQEILKSHLRHLRLQNVKDGAVLVVERETGRVLVYVGSSGELSSAPLVDHVQSLRQAGSTLKPLLYAAAISERLITMTSPLRDEPFSVTREGLTYQPENYQKGFTFQDVPAKVALGSSLNIPAVRVIDYLGPDRFYDLLTQLEFRDLYESEHYGHSMALGSVDITLWDLVRSYGALASTGIMREPRLTPEMPLVTKTLPLFTEEVSFILGHILAEKNNRHLTFGIQSTLSTESWSAVKTGTSKDMRDNWCVGFTDKYLIGVWVGNSSGQPMWNVTGISGAAPVFSQLVSLLHEENASQAPAPPKNLVRIGDDYYLPGTEPKGQGHSVVEKPSVAKIIFPQRGAQFAFDPEIPLENQKILFQASGDGLHWKLNGTRTKDHLIPQRSGRYLLQLLDAKGEIKDEVSFFVKAGKVL